MNYQAANNYLKTKVFTATPEQLQLMLYDGAIRFTDQGKSSLEKKDYEGVYNALSRAQKILTELQCGLKHDVAPELCGKLSALYTFVFRKLVDASIHHQMEPIDEALQILRYQRETWVLLLDQLGKAKAGVAATRIDMPAPNEQMERQLRMTA
ncbi:MAG TPA: flagellar export chaperone FliS [Tepidisphaeraceae bacterium]|nr:flagellar export chaperone FliS [Tepidisphaeraceae bacterium]